MTINGYLRRLESEIFKPYDIDKLEQGDRCNFHAMTSEHAEILGQFLDHSTMTPDELKRCLILGYLEYITGTVRIKEDEYYELLEYKSMYESLCK